MQLEIFTTRTIPKNRDELGRFCTERDFKNREVRYWKNKAQMYERAYFAVTKRLNEISRNGTT